MNKNERNTYYFNAVNGVTPADHDIAYDINWCWGEGGNYNIASARLEIENGKSYNEYLEDISGHYVEGVKSWDEAHEYLVDLVQAMLLELGSKRYGMDAEIGQLSAYICENYGDGTMIEYSADYYVNDGSIVLFVEGYGEAKGKTLNREALAQMLNVSPEDIEL